MYRVVLVDDEPLILRGLSQVVRWEEHGCAVAGTAGSADEGARLIRELKPHIVITDIKMPGVDGLTMLAGLKNEFPKMQITVLTGYRDFSYAQEAIRLGVTRYLLKPSKMDELEEALSAMTEKLDAEPSDEEEPAPDPASGSFIVKQALAFIEANHARKLTLQEVADHCFVSKWHLSKLINGQTGKSYYDLLNTVRVEKAKELLKEPGLKIGEIAEMVGCPDNAHFARIFKKLVGVSANEYRNQILG